MLVVYKTLKREKKFSPPPCSEAQTQDLEHLSTVLPATPSALVL